MIETAYSAFDHLERYLEADQFLVGDSLTLADMAVGTTVTNFLIWLPLDAAKYVRTFAWLERVAKAFPKFKEMDEPFVNEFAEVFKAKLLENQKN